MSTAQLIGEHSKAFRQGAEGRDGDPPGGTRRSAMAAPLAAVLAGALLVIVLYAAFAHGAVALSTEARIQVAVAATAAIAGAGWLWVRRLTFSPSPLATGGIWLLGAFAAWSGVTLLWSVAPDQTWIELNRAVCYAIVLCLAIAIGSSYRRAIAFVAKGFLAIALAVTAYALGQKLFPGIHVPGLFNLNQTGPLPRLQEPFGYWNALALFVVLAVPIALALAVDARRSAKARLAALCAVELMLLVIAFTFSRGGLLALVVALAVGIALSGARLRSLMWLALTIGGALAPLVVGLTSDSLTTAAVPLGRRETAGGVLAAVLLGSLAALVIAGRGLLSLERRVSISSTETRKIGRLLAALAAAIFVAAVVAVSFSSRGLGGSISHAWKTFTTTQATSNYDSHRLLSADSENRWVWWKEAAGAFSDRPIGGWGAGSFPVVHLLYRRDNLTVRQPHSVPLQFLAETGIVGGLLGGAALIVLLAAASGALRQRPVGADRLLAAGLFAAGIAYAVHCLYDWDWDIPGVTLPALIFLGVLIGSRRLATQGGGDDRSSSALATAGTLNGPLYAGAAWRGSGVFAGLGRGGRAVFLGALTLFLCIFAVSATLPSLAASKANAALVAASGSSSTQLQHARQEAALASRLDPLSDMGLRAEATIAFHQGQLEGAVKDLVAAIRRDPTDVQAWSQLEVVDSFRRDTQDVSRISRRVLELDPRALRASLPGGSGPPAPSSSPTAIPTPISGG